MAITEPQPKLAQFARNLQKSPAVLLTKKQAEAVCLQFQETATHRGWRLLAAAVMANHFHVVVAVSDDPDPKRMLVDLKAYASRILNRKFNPQQPADAAPRKWWTKGGSRRKLPDHRAVAAAVNYVLHKQPHPLVVWSPESDLDEH